MESMYNITIEVACVYLVVISWFSEVNNKRSYIVLKALPFIIALSLAIGHLTSLGYIVRIP